MRAVLYERYGGPEQLVLHDVPVPVPGPDEVLVRVVAAGINPLDWKLLRGDFRLVRGRRAVRFTGCDFAGRVETVGAAVRDLRPDAAVFGSVNPLRGDRGALAEFVVAKATALTLKPEKLSFAEAAALPGSGASALDCLRLGGARSGRLALVIGAAGGIGTFAVQIARAWGLRVVGVCSERNAAFVETLGAERALAYDREDFLARPETYDLVIDAVGRYPFGPCRRLLTEHGIHVETVPGPWVYFDVGRTRLLGGRQARALMVRIDRAKLDELAGLAASGKIRPVVGERFAFTDHRAAYAASRSGHARGKLVIEVAPEAGPGAAG
jgi:NADPH:quinone reductase-like Zn-dependent oxidoreductase